MRGRLDNLIELCVGGCLDKALVFKHRRLEVMDAAGMPELHHHPGKTQSKTMLPMHVITRFNMLHDPSEIVGKSLARAEPQQDPAAKNRCSEVDLISFHGRFP